MYETGLCTEHDRQPFEQSRCVEDAALAVSRRLRHDGQWSRHVEKAKHMREVGRYTKTDEIDKKDLQYTV